MTKKPVSKIGRSNVKAAWLDAARSLADQAVDEDLVKDPNLPRNGIKAGEWAGAPWDAMPPGCPVQVLGHDGKVTYCRSATGQLMEIERWSNGEIETLFAPYLNYLHWAWPAKASPGKDENGDPLPAVVKRLERDKARNALLNEGRRRGLFDPQDSVRGRGGWKDRTDNFVWNSGEYIWTVNRGRLEASRPAQYDGFFYEVKTDVLQPWLEPVPIDASPALRILKDVGTWSFERQRIDPLFIIGWMATSLMGGALDWRPIIFTAGGAGVGKSSLQKLIKGTLLKALLDTTDTTQAGIYQRVRNDSLPVMVDELENEPGSTRAMSIVKLARLAASGGYMNRGGADHEGVMFQARNSFLFSAINPPPLESQDKSRMPILNLARLDASRKALRLTMNEADGRMLLRQIMDGWRPFHDEILPRWKLALHDSGMDSRAQDTYGTLLAAAELLVGPDALEDAGLDTTEMLRAGAVIAGLTSVERSEQTDNWQSCLEHLLASPIEAWRSGERITVGSVIDDYRHNRIDEEQAKHRLAAAGLGVRKPGEPCTGLALAIPHKKLPALARIFQETHWHGGVWAAALKQGPKDIVLRDLPEKKFHLLRINGVPMKCLLIDMQGFDRWASIETG